MQLGIVQGRLIKSPPGCLQWFPQKDWESEFFLARSVGFNYIELVSERQHNAKNPIWLDSGIDRIKSLLEDNNLLLPTLCEDYIIDHSLLEDESSENHLYEVIERGALLGVNKLILPLFEKSELNSKNIAIYAPVLRSISAFAEQYNILVCIETILNGAELVTLVELVDHENISCVFDTGNRIAFGHELAKDIVTLGNNIGHVHIKDKNKMNENVLLGSGLVNFKEVFEAFREIKYDGFYTFETFRGVDPVETAIFNMQFVKFFARESLAYAD